MLKMRPSCLLERGQQEHKSISDSGFSRYIIYGIYTVFTLFEHFKHAMRRSCCAHLTAWRFMKVLTSKTVEWVWILKLKTAKSLSVFRKFCTDRLWNRRRELQDEHEKPKPGPKHLTQQTSSVNQARNAQAIFNTILCVMQLFPHATGETQSTNDASICMCHGSMLSVGNRSVFGTTELNATISSNVSNCFRYTIVKKKCSPVTPQTAIPKTVSLRNTAWEYLSEKIRATCRDSRRQLKQSAAQPWSSSISDPKKKSN